MSEPKEIFVKIDKCTGCKSCAIACAVEHSQCKNLFGAMQERPLPKSCVYVEWVAPDKNVPVLCRHCEDAPCMHACITGAISQDQEGIVTTDEDKCIGCWTCVMVCPYGVIGRHMEKHKAYRCDRCPDLEIPACVSSCPTKALIYNTAENYSHNIRKNVSNELVSGEN